MAEIPPTRFRASGSSSPAIAAWSARRSCRRLEGENCIVLTADPGRARPDRPGRRQRLVRAQTARRGVPRRGERSAASSPIDTQPADFLYENLMIEANIIHAAHIRRGEAAVSRLVLHLSEIRRPADCRDALLTGPLEPTNEWYAIAKIAGIKLCQAYRKQHGATFISAMPTNLYGTGDNYDLKTSHVLPALIRKVHEAKAAGAPSIELWGSGTPLREFMHVDDCADALVFLMQTLFRRRSDTSMSGTGSDLQA
jgi:GDP-L-fucose synthase